MEQRRWLLLALALLLAIPFSGSVFPGASQWVSASWIQLSLFLLTLAAGSVLVFQGRRVDSLETVWLKNHQHLYQKIQTLQEVFQNEQESTQRDIQLLRTDLENELGLTIEANTTNTLESMWKKDLHEVSQQVQTLQKAFQNTHVYTQRDLQVIRTDLKDELGKTLEANVRGNIAYMWQKDLLQLSQQIQTLKQTFQNMKVAIQCDLQMIRTDLENKVGGTVEAKTSTLESRLEKDHHETSQQIQTLQENFQNTYETTQHDLQMIRTDLEHDLGRTVEANTRTMESMWKKDLLQLSQQMQTLQEAFQNMEGSTQCDLQMIRADMKNELGRTVEANTRTMESMWKKDLLQLSQQMQTLQEAFQNMEGSTQCDLQMIRADMKNELGRRVKENTSRVLESMRLMDIQQLSQEIQTLEKTLQTTLRSTKYDFDLPVLRSYKGGICKSSPSQRVARDNTARRRAANNPDLKAQSNRKQDASTTV
ncbi:uncharacterized protein LOC128816782 isoform X6 [Vidua macroura]|uniref:uncharacterized protein LOC128816782 isoform X6 n=1 Tax=Vidua macroura TaxID=187451 RepID=UPI0023A87101|nr:uncharacterized protein LOC128816782 isoform X6 [Vidua macroura]